MKLLDMAAQTSLKILNTQETPNLPTATPNHAAFSKAFTTLFVIIGAVAVLLIVIAGLRYILSGGDATKAAEARRSIIHIAVGLIVASLAYSIVTLIVSRLA